MTATEPQPAARYSKLRWYQPSPGRLLVALLAVEGVLLLSEWFGWFAFNRQTWTVLIALAAVGATLLVMFVWLVVALLFRRRFQFTLRSLLVLTVAVAIPFSWLAVEMKWEREQKAAAMAIVMKTGGNVTSEQTWLGELLRDESLMNVTEVGLGGRSITDAGLADLEALSQLQRLDLYDTQVSDAGLEHLQGLSQLLSLSLAGTEVTDAGLTHLRGLKHLQYLELFDTQVTNEGVKKLQQALPNCEIKH